MAGWQKSKEILRMVVFHFGSLGRREERGSVARGCCLVQSARRAGTQCGPSSRRARSWEAGILGGTYHMKGSQSFEI